MIFDMEFSHKSVLLDEVIEGLNIKPNGIYADGTMGGAGHSEAICRRLTDTGRLVCIDRDEDAINAGSARLKPYGDKVKIVRSNYSDITNIIHQIGYSTLDGIVLDLGVSSFQLDTPERGFSYRMDSPLDMRMDNRAEVSAFDVVNEYSEMEIYRIIRDYGEDRFAKNIAKHIVSERKKEPIYTTGKLAEVVSGAIPMKIKKKGSHPAKRTFQAIRIEVNKELDVLEDALRQMIEILNDNGRLCIISFHSLEDRIVKRAFKKAADPCTCPPEFPVCVCGKKPLGVIVTRKPIIPSEKEILENPRAKSAKLRIFEKRLN